MALRFGELEHALVADVVELLYRMVRVEVLIGSTLGGVGLVAAGVFATVLKVYLG